MRAGAGAGEGLLPEAGRARHAASPCSSRRGHAAGARPRGSRDAGSGGWPSCGAPPRPDWPLQAHPRGRLSPPARAGAPRDRGARPRHPAATAAGSSPLLRRSRPPPRRPTRCPLCSESSSRTESPSRSGRRRRSQPHRFAAPRMPSASVPPTWQRLRPPRGAPPAARRAPGGRRRLALSLTAPGRRPDRGRS